MPPGPAGQRAASQLWAPGVSGRAGRGGGSPRTSPSRSHDAPKPPQPSQESHQALGTFPLSARPSTPREPQAPGRPPGLLNSPQGRGDSSERGQAPPDLPRAGAAPGAAIATSPGHAGSAARAPPFVRLQTLPARAPAGKCGGNISSGGKRPYRAGIAGGDIPEDPEGPSVASGGARNVLDVLPAFVLGWRNGFMGIDFTFFPVAGFGFGMGDLVP